VSRNGEVVSFDATDGKELWAVGDLSGNLIPSPTVAGCPGVGRGLTSDQKAAAVELLQRHLRRLPPPATADRRPRRELEDRSRLRVGPQPVGRVLHGGAGPYLLDNPISTLSTTASD